ncbi:MAG: hypothetical protein DRP66_02565 [Planctomycetota bacterium]|nr:MAG: hypothetical protein DRP66_02565 [Planctomycetota bacterium]
MAEFTYNAVNGSGEAVSGVINAVDQRSAVAELVAKGLFASEMFEESESSRGGAGAGAAGVLDSIRSIRFRRSRVSSKDLLQMTTQLGAALRAGLPILNAIEIIEAQQHKPAVKELLGHLAGDVSSGKALSDAMAERPEIFSNLYSAMVRVGETGGILDKTMKQLIGLIARDESIRTSMKNAAAYPLFVLGVGFVSVIIVLTRVLPKIVESMSAPTALLPLPTRMLMATSDFLVAYGWLVAIVLGLAVFAFVKFKRTAGGRLMWDGFKLRIPMLGPVLKTIAVGRFARTLGALTECGITILHALAVVRDTLGNEVLGRAIDEVTSRVKAGEPLAEPLAESGLFPPLLVQIVSIGEQTGKLDELLLNAADTFDDEADQAVARFMAVFPAILILLLALVVGFIIAATLLPIMGMSIGGAT